MLEFTSKWLWGLRLCKICPLCDFAQWKSVCCERMNPMIDRFYISQLIHIQINIITSHVIAPIIPQTLLCPKSLFLAHLYSKSVKMTFPEVPSLTRLDLTPCSESSGGELFARQRMIYKFTDLERASAGQDLSPLPFWWWMSGELSKSEHRVTSPENVN